MKTWTKISGWHDDMRYTTAAIEGGVVEVIQYRFRLGNTGHRYTAMRTTVIMRSDSGHRIITENGGDLRSAKKIAQEI